MVSRDSSISYLFVRRSFLSTKYSIILFLLVLVFAVNVLFSGFLPSWIKDIDYIEIIVLVFVLLSGYHTYLSISDHETINRNFRELGFEKGETFSYKIADKTYKVDKAWRYAGSESFEIKNLYPSGVLRVTYNFPTSDKIVEQLKIKSGDMKIIKKTDKILFEIPEVLKVDDFIEILDILRNIETT